MKRTKRLNILVSAGPTREAIDPVRFISNYSTGFFGYEIAREAKRRGHRIVLVSGTTSLAKTKGISVIDVVTALQMEKALEKNFHWCDCLIMSAAVADFQVKKAAKFKIKRDKKELILRLKQSSDILRTFGRKMLRQQSRRKGKKVLAGVALETENLKKNALSKLRKKNLDLIVATQMKAGSYPFGLAKMDALIIDKKGQIHWQNRATKSRLSRILLDSIEKAVLY